jgi:hypothetical protein
MLPADERLDARQRLIAQSDDRLVFQEQLFLLESGRQSGR